MRKSASSSVIPSVKASETKSSKFGQYDSLVRMEQERRKLVKALDLNKNRIQTGMKMLQQKTDKKKATGKYVLNPSQATKVAHGYSVEDFRISPTRRKTYKEVKIYNCEDIEPTTIKDPNMKRIREQNLKSQVCKKRIDDLIHQKHVAEVKKKEREFKKLPKLQRRSMPKINVPLSMLPNRYVRGELPCTIEHGINGQYLSWVCPLDNLDYEFYLPIFFDGLQCRENPAKFLARQGIEDLLFASKGFPNRIKACVYSLVKPLRNALSKFDPEILLGVLRALQQLVTCNEGIGEVLMPFSKQFLAPIATFMDLNKNLGDSIDYAQRKDDDIGENVRNTLELLEEKGGPNAYKQIKFSVPLYESVLNSKVVSHGV